MSDPIKENISADILTAVNEITTDAGFNQTLIARRAMRIDFNEDNPPATNRVVITQTEAEDLTPGISKNEWLQHYDINCIVVGSDTDSTTIETLINRVEADVIKKLRVDPQRSGNALDTIILSPESPGEDSGFTGIIVKVAVHYRHNQDDPYTL